MYIKWAYFSTRRRLCLWLVISCFTLNGFQHRREWKTVFSSKVSPSSVRTGKLVMAWCQPPDKASFSSMTKNTKPLTSMFQKDSNTSLFSFGSREVEQCPAIGIADLGRVSLLQHSPDSVHITCCHCSLDLQLLMKLRVPSAVMVQHPATFQRGNIYLCLKWRFSLTCKGLYHPESFTHFICCTLNIVYLKYTCYTGAWDNEAKEGIESLLPVLLSLLKNNVSGIDTTWITLGLSLYGLPQSIKSKSKGVKSPLRSRSGHFFVSISIS